MRRLTTIGCCLAATVAAGLTTGTEAGATTQDVTPPSTPTNLRVIGWERGNPVLGWDPATDNSGQVYHYWVLVDGYQRTRPRAATVSINSLLKFCRIDPGRRVITVQAVDRQLNRSAPSGPIEVNVVL